MIVHRITNVFGDKHFAFRESALEQEFLTKDPTERDDVLRSGLRTEATVCFDWPGFEQLWKRVGQQVRDIAYEIDPASVSPSSKPRQIELTRMTTDGRFKPHVDAGYRDVLGPTVSFVYYIGVRATFTGGEFRVGDEIVEPGDDSLIVFPGEAVHEILPIVGDGALRLTVNGFIDAQS